MSKKSAAASVICRILGLLLVLLVIAFCLALLLPPLFGCQVYSITSASMEPALPKGSIIYVKETPYGDINVGDIIAYDRSIQGDYELEGAVIAHRVVEKRVVEGLFITKGDANQTEDLNPVSYNQIIGTVVFHMPRIGQFMVIYTSTAGKVCLIMVALCGVLLNILAGRLHDSRD